LENFFFFADFQGGKMFMRLSCCLMQGNRIMKFSGKMPIILKFYQNG